MAKYFLPEDASDPIIMKIDINSMANLMISATCEIVVDVIDGKVDRKFSEEIGLNLFEF